MEKNEFKGWLSLLFFLDETYLNRLRVKDFCWEPSWNVLHCEDGEIN
jgi:hypothetical protein